MNEYETFVKLILPDAVRKWDEESCEVLIYANNSTKCPLCWEMSDIPWLDAACALGYHVPEEDE